MHTRVVTCSAVQVCVVHGVKGGQAGMCGTRQMYLNTVYKCMYDKHADVVGGSQAEARRWTGGRAGGRGYTNLRRRFSLGGV